MSDERDVAVRAFEHADHARWAAEHRAWAEQVAAWRAEVAAEAGALRRLASALDERERALLEQHADALRRHEAVIAQHEVVLAALDRGDCAGCEPLGAPPHGAAAEAHERERARHADLAKRRAAVRSLVRELDRCLSEPG